MDETIKLGGQDHIGHGNSQDEREDQIVKSLAERCGAARDFGLISRRKSVFGDFFDGLKSLLLGLSLATLAYTGIARDRFSRETN